MSNDSGFDPVEFIEKYQRKISKSGDCLLWTGATINSGYGYLTVNKKNKTAHRASYEASHGPVPEGMQVLHRCDVKLCVNPEHLFVGTQQENIDDMINKGRWSMGDRRRNAKLTTKQVIAIRADTRNRNEIARELNVKSGTIYSIQSGQRWRHV